MLALYIAYPIFHLHFYRILLIIDNVSNRPQLPSFLPDNNNTGQEARTQSGHHGHAGGRGHAPHPHAGHPILYKLG